VDAVGMARSLVGQPFTLKPIEGFEFVEDAK
jgi:hypothetical protein